MYVQYLKGNKIFKCVPLVLKKPPLGHSRLTRATRTNQSDHDELSAWIKLV